MPLLLGGQFFAGSSGGAATLAISGSPVLTATRDVAYAGFTPSVIGGTAPYTFTIAAGALPTGMSISASTGAVTGTPSVFGSFAGIVIRVTDAESATDDLAAFTLTVEPAAVVSKLDFLNAYYFAGGSEQAIGSLLGVGFDAGEISGSGMLVNSANGNRPDAIGDLLADFIASFNGGGCTIFFEIDTTAKLDGTLISLHDPTNGGFYFTDYTFDVFFNNSPDFNLRVLDTSEVSATGGAADQLASGVQRIAVTIFEDLGGGSYQSAASINGGTAFTDTSTYNTAPFTLTMVELFHITGLSGFDDNIKATVRSVVLYGSALSTTDIAALSTL